MPRAKLRAVKPDERPPSRREFTSVLDAAKESDLLGMLEQMRVVIAKKVDDPNTSGRDLAALTKRLTEVNNEIAAERRHRAEEGADVSEAEDGRFDASAV